MRVKTFPLIKLAKKLKVATLQEQGENLTISIISKFPLIKLAKKLKDIIANSCPRSCFNVSIN